MKQLLRSILFGLILVSCKKSNNSNILSGSWAENRVVDQYLNPYNNNVEFDTLSSPSILIEFKDDGTYYIEGTQSGSYLLSSDTSYTLKPNGTVYNFDISNNVLKTRRVGMYGEQIQIFDPVNLGAYKYANVQFVFAEYQKQ
jgi:hypothetical protein